MGIDGSIVFERSMGVQCACSTTCALRYLVALRAFAQAKSRAYIARMTYHGLIEVVWLQSASAHPPRTTRIEGLGKPSHQSCPKLMTPPRSLFISRFPVLICLSTSSTVLTVSAEASLEEEMTTLADEDASIIVLLAEGFDGAVVRTALTQVSLADTSAERFFVIDCGHALYAKLRQFRSARAVMRRTLSRVGCGRRSGTGEGSQISSC